jgi:hypothetical protein
VEDVTQESIPVVVERAKLADHCFQPIWREELGRLQRFDD